MSSKEDTKIESTPTIIKNENVCRACLSLKDNMRSVFSEDKTTGQKIPLFEMLKSLTSVQVMENDGLPDQMCPQCVYDLIKAYSFKHLCESSDAKLRMHLQESLNTDIDLNLVKIEDSVDKDPIPVYTEINNSLETHSHNLNITDIKNEGVESSITDESISFEMVSLVASDVNTDLPTLMNNSEIENDMPEATIVLSSDDEDTNKEEKNRIECDNTEQSIQPCKQCTFYFTTKEEAKDHLNTYSLTCKVCKQVFISSRGLLRPKDTDNGPRKHLCRECGKEFLKSVDFAHHLITDCRDRSYACNICKRVYKQKFQLLEHMKTHSTSKSFTCAVCKKIFSRFGTFVTHFKTHIAELPTCGVCGKKYTSEDSLIAHVKTHKGHNFVCKFCGRRFSFHTNLVIHERTHTGENPYACNACGNFFSEFSNLIAHKCIQKNKTPYVCTKCGYAFASSSHLKIHMSSKHSVNEGVSTRGKSLLKMSEDLGVHIKKETGDVVSSGF